MCFAYMLVCVWGVCVICHFSVLVLCVNHKVSSYSVSAAAIHHKHACFLYTRNIRTKGSTSLLPCRDLSVQLSDWHF